MISNCSNDQIKDLVLKQLKNFFIVNQDATDDELICSVEDAISLVEECFSKINNKYYHDDDGNALFSTNHSAQYSIFLYYLSNVLYRSSIDGKKHLLEPAEQIYYLNKIMHGVDWFYAIDLPPHFLVEHPVGSVLGRAKYGDYLCIYQNVSIGGVKKSGSIIYPSIGNNVTLFANSCVLGDCNIGDNVIIGANTKIINKDIPSNSKVIQKEGRIIISENNLQDDLGLWSISC